MIYNRIFKLLAICLLLGCVSNNLQCKNTGTFIQDRDVATFVYNNDDDTGSNVSDTVAISDGLISIQMGDTVVGIVIDVSREVSQIRNMVAEGVALDGIMEKFVPILIERGIPPKCIVDIINNAVAGYGCGRAIDISHEAQIIKLEIQKGRDLTEIIKEFGYILVARDVSPDGIIAIISSIANECGFGSKLPQLYMNIVSDMLDLKNAPSKNTPSDVLGALVPVAKKYGFHEGSIIDMMCQCYENENKPVVIVVNDVVQWLLKYNSPSNALVTLAPVVGGYGFSQDELIDMICRGFEKGNRSEAIIDIASYKLRIHVDPRLILNQLAPKIFAPDSNRSVFVFLLVVEMIKQNYSQNEINSFIRDFLSR